MLIGYMRVSTGEQSLDLQRDALERAGFERVYEDICSGRTTERPGLAQALEGARGGDALAVWKLDRIGRSLPHVVRLVGDLQKRGVGLKVLTGDVGSIRARPYPRAHDGRPCSRVRPRPRWQAQACHDEAETEGRNGDDG